ncbi:MAG: translation initiation factor IF-2 [Bacteroidales bacterium]|nr:translation initiation factor IF-2 [Bacteroidales bacterium]
MKIRLGKAAREFNVSSATIVEFLAQKGLPIENSDNSKLTPEMYELLKEKYQLDKDSKEKASQIEIGYASKIASDKEKKEALEKKEKERLEKEKEKAKAERLAQLKSEPAGPVEEKPAPEPETPQIEQIPVKEEIKVEELVKKPKIVGVIDLEKANRPTKPQKKPKAEKAKKEDIEKEKSSKKKVEKQKEAKSASEPIEKQPVKEQSVEEQPIETPSIEENISQETPANQETPLVAVAEDNNAAPKQPEHIETVIPQLKAPTITGKIDLDSLNVKTKPKKKTKEELRKEKEERIRTEKALYAEQKAKKSNSREKTEDKDADNFIKTTVETLAGTKVVGKIENLDAINNGKSKEGNKKEKRKRITKFSAEDKAPMDNVRRQDVYNRKKEKHKEKRPDISQEEIELQIKRTKAKLAPLGKTAASKHRKDKRQAIMHEKEEEQQRQALESKILKVTEFITANELAIMMNVPVSKVIATCMSIGLFVSINQRLEKDYIILLAKEFGFEVEFSDSDVEDYITEEQNPEQLEPRAPIVTVMGHVDHGKTSLLDYIRKTNVIAGEAGGITQHIGAYEVHLPDGRRITFLDTPGHEAFTAMRARGAKITDIVIIVIAADDSIMPQTIEAINHAQAAGVPMIFAINKIDKPGADPDKIRTALANMNLLVEEWGGKIQSQEISAKKGTNVDILLEKVLIEAEMLDLKANPHAVAMGTVIESSLDKGRGYVAKMLIQNGTLHKGDIVVAGTSYGKIKVMYNERNQAITAAGPSTPVLLLGLDSAPQAGDTFKVYGDEREAKSVVSKRQQLLREQGLRTQKHITLDEIGRRIAQGNFKELNIIIKGDVDGSIEALSDSLLRLSTDEVQVSVIHKSVGQVTESDVLLASASNAIIIAFQVRPSGSAKKLAEQEQIDIRTYSVIYDAINDLKDAIDGMKAPELKETIVCNLEVRETFRIPKVGVIAGCYVLNGKIQRTTRIRIIRDGIVIFTGRLGSLKRFKDDAKEVLAGYECGLNIESFNDIKIGDIIEGFEEIEVKK